MSDVHVDGAARIASVAKEIGIDRFIHVSALAASPLLAGTSSEWAKSKREGEKAVRAILPEATILRPAPLWGAQDHFLHPRAAMVCSTSAFPSDSPVALLARLPHHLS